MRSQEIITEQYAGTSMAGGVPGVDANIPGYVGRTALRQSTARQETMTNYELNRTESYFTSSPGKVSLLSVAVWLNGQYTPNQLAAVEEAVSRAIGLQPSRGDSIFVDAVPFETGGCFWAEGPSVQYVEAPNYFTYMILGAVILAAIIALVIIFVGLPQRGSHGTCGRRPRCDCC